MRYKIYTQEGFVLYLNVQLFLQFFKQIFQSIKTT